MHQFRFCFFSDAYAFAYLYRLILLLALTFTQNMFFLFNYSSVIRDKNFFVMFLSKKVLMNYGAVFFLFIWLKGISIGEFLLFK